MADDTAKKDTETSIVAASIAAPAGNDRVSTEATPLLARNDATAETPAEPEDLPELEDASTHDEDSAHGDSEGSTGSTSVTSSIRRGYVEGGRRYQSLRENNFNVPSDEKLHACRPSGSHGHEISTRQPLLPQSDLQECSTHIDFGTGSGGWASDVADVFPNLTVHGVDLYPPPAEWVPPNCIFEVDDFTKPWSWNFKFDLVHMRLLAGALPRGERSKMYKRIYHNLAPGGWVEHVEPNLTFHSLPTNPLPEGSLLSRWKKTMTSCMEKTVNEAEVTSFMRQEIEDAGFISIQEVQFKMPTGDWHHHPMYKDSGRLNTIHFKEGLQGWVTFALTHFGTDKPWSQEEAVIYVAKMRQELDAGYHLWQTNTRIWAQKPFDAPKDEPKHSLVENVEDASA